MFASFLSAVAITGVALGVFALTVVMSVMMGFNRDLQEKLIGFNAHLIVSSAKPDNAGFEKAASIVGSAAEQTIQMVEGEGIIGVTGKGEGSVQGVKIRGIGEGDLQKLKNVKWIDFNSSIPWHLSAVFLGNELADNLEFDAYKKDTITLTVPFGSVGPTGDVVPSKMQFAVAGVFNSGYFEHDSKVVIVPPADAAKLLRDNAAYSLHIWLKNEGAAEKFAQEIKKALPNLSVTTWTQSNKKLFAALKLERIAMSLLLILIIAIASVSIVSVIFMYVYVRKKDIAILACIGATRASVRAIFVKIGAYIGVIGTAIGLSAGLAVCYYLKQHPMVLPSSYYLDRLPVIISVPFLAIVAVCGVAIAMLGALYPASQAAHLDPMKSIRYE